MKIIADSGSTKTMWTVAMGDQVVSTVTTGGLNPYFHTPESAAAVIRSELAPGVAGYSIVDIHFYGAGCSTDRNDAMIRDALGASFPHAEIAVHHDILGAARALFGRGSGIACILGTGCNSCYYDGVQTFPVVDSLGYLFGDEGAGSNLGKRFLGAYLRKELPDDLRREFDDRYGYSLSDILNSLYNEPSPNRYLASFSHFLAPRREHPWVRDLVKGSFREFFMVHIRKYSSFPPSAPGFIGSVAFVYRELLEEVAREEQVAIARIIASPMEGLLAFHNA